MREEERRDHEGRREEEAKESVFRGRVGLSEQPGGPSSDPGTTV